MYPNVSFPFIAQKNTLLFQEKNRKEKRGLYVVATQTTRTWSKESSVRAARRRDTDWLSLALDSALLMHSRGGEATFPPSSSNKWLITAQHDLLNVSRAVIFHRKCYRDFWKTRFFGFGCVIFFFRELDRIVVVDFNFEKNWRKNTIFR